ncbi:DNA recombination protein RmuC [Anaeroarcus burkinensis]|uniref:DNA recombination protein RmuC n=1 Tax=Anaeroarcus burkinensis TaxID=82376 RepID=UPI00042300FE|nr:DNA recombination protein RmuC [Anaeroarcus burkinensis]
MDTATITLLAAALLQLLLILWLLQKISRLSNAKEESESEKEKLRQELQESRRELRETLQDFNDSVLRRLAEHMGMQLQQTESMSSHLQNLTQAQERRQEHLRQSLEAQMESLRLENGRRLEEIRAMVDERLQQTLERKLGESFQWVSERLEMVHKGLGEMQNLAASVGDLKKVLTNVKTRGTWGEIQLAALLSDVLAPEQYAANVAVVPGRNERVEFALRLPGQGETGCIWLPVDAKFPQEDFLRLQEARETGDAEGQESAAKKLEQRLRLEAKSIAEKYVAPPHTTDFALLFLPTEGLYAEVLQRPGLAEELLRRHRVVVTGPMTLAALLNSLQLGFRTLAIEQRSAEVWELLGAVRGEFARFGLLLEKTQKKLQEASFSIESAAKTSRSMEQRLSSLQQWRSEGVLDEPDNL